MTAPSIGVYIHVPYCKLLCPYCDFVKKPAKDPAALTAFTLALCDEIARFDGPDNVTTVFFGGGTPSLLAPAELDRSFDALHRRFHLNAHEISFEVNPDDVTADALASWKKVGINRVSLGVQSFDDAVLRYLGRVHDAATAKVACARLADSFENWNIDLMFGAPPIPSWTQSLRSAIDLAPAHVSTYGLTYEPNTPFARRANEAIDDDVYVDLYREADALLNEAGFVHYEVSNFARPAYQSEHNLLYWHNLEYAGFGPGAYSFLGDVRSRNQPGISAYEKEPGVKAEALTLSPREVRIETVLQHFRLKDGLPRARYLARFGCDVEDDFGSTLQALYSRGLLACDASRIWPTTRGFELNNEIGLAVVE